MEILYRASSARSKTIGIVLCCDDGSYYFDGKMYIEFKDGSSGNFFYSDNEFKKADWIVTKEEANQLRKERESLEKEKDLQNSINNYQELLRLNNIIEKKFQKKSKKISEETKQKINDIIIKKNEK